MQQLLNHFWQDSVFEEGYFTFPRLYASIVKHFPTNSHFVEVGSWKGKSVAFLGVEIVNSGKKIAVDAVDTWAGSPSEESHQNDVYVKTNTLYQLFLSNISTLSNIITPVRMPSLDAANLYEDESIDVVFIDAGHTYEDVKADISAWLPKVKIGGWLAGHDYPWSHNDEVKKAVDESVSPIDQLEGCWIYRKP